MPVVLESPVPGDQVYVFAPAAVNEVELSSHIFAFTGFTVTVGVGFTVRVTVEELLQLKASVPFTVYVIVLFS